MRMYAPWFSLLCLLTLALLLGGCGGGSNGTGGGGTGLDSRFTGTWLPASARVNDATTAISDALDWDDNVIGETLTFTSGGAVTRTTTAVGGAATEAAGTFTAANGQGTLTFAPDPAQAFTYVFSGSATVTVSFTAGERAISVTFVKVATLSRRDSALVGTWQFTGAQVNGANVPLADFFGWQPQAAFSRVAHDGPVPTSALVQLQSGGAATMYHLCQPEGNTTVGGWVAAQATGTWATGSNTFTLNIPQVTNVRGAYTLGNGVLTLTFFESVNNEDHAVVLTAQRWNANPSEAHPASAVGTWTMTSVKVNGQVANLADVFNWEENTTTSRVILFSDGTLIIRELAGEAVVFTTVGKWDVTSLTDLVLTLEEQIPGTYTINSARTQLVITATMEVNEADATVALTLTK